jgi:hypothetical protein
MYYEINVSKMTPSVSRPYYKHFFATAERSITTLADMQQVYAALKAAFPQPEYLLTVSRYETSGYVIDMEKL